MSYWLRGMGQAAGGTQLVPLPNYANCDPRDTPCTISNQALSDAYNAAVIQAQAANNAQQCIDNAANATSDAQRAQVLAACAGQYATQGGAPSAAPAVFTGGPGSVPFSYSSGGGAPPATAVAIRPGTFSFSTSRGSNAMQVGDTWLVTITGASPGLQVAVRGSMPGGSIAPTSEGVTDGSGNFTKSGTVGTAEIGSWQETWSVGSSDTGSVSFTVSPSGGSAANPPGAPAATPGVSLPGSAAPTTLGVPSALTNTVLGIPLWGWAAGAGVVFLAFGGKLK